MTHIFYTLMCTIDLWPMLKMKGRLMKVQLENRNVHKLVNICTLQACAFSFLRYIIDKSNQFSNERGMRMCFVKTKLLLNTCNLLLFNYWMIVEGSYSLEREEKENKIQRSKELWEEVKSYWTPCSPKLLFIFQSIILN